MRPPQALVATVVEDSDELAAIVPAWDELTVAARLPMACPAWTLAWWRHLRPEGWELRAVVVRDGDEVVGVAPYAASRTRARTEYRLIGSGVSLRIGPLAREGREAEVAQALARALGDARPRPGVVTFEGVPATSPWPGLVREAWPGRPRPVAYPPTLQGAPTVALEAESFDAWMAARSQNFRSQMRRMRRRLADAGGHVRLSDETALRGDVEALMRLHGERWEGRGRSTLVTLGPRLADALEEAGRALLASGRFRLWVVEVEGRPVSAQIFVAAGGELSYWNGGFDEDHARLKPAMLGILAAIEDAFERGDRRLDLGGGEQPYKLRFADGNDPIMWQPLVPTGPGAAVAHATLGPQILRGHARNLLKARLSAEQAQRLRALRGRLRG